MNIKNQLITVSNFLTTYRELNKLFESNPEILNESAEALELYSKIFKLSFDDLPIPELCEVLSNNIKNQKLNCNLVSFCALDANLKDNAFQSFCDNGLWIIDEHGNEFSPTINEIKNSETVKNKIIEAFNSDFFYFDKVTGEITITENF